VEVQVHQSFQLFLFGRTNISHLMKRNICLKVKRIAHNNMFSSHQSTNILRFWITLC